MLAHAVALSPERRIVLSAAVLLLLAIVGLALVAGISALAVDPAMAGT
ncbi:MAG TPA: hypothetical protein VGA38_13445 [Candidatus Limnocylindria bacterium]